MRVKQFVGKELMGADHVGRRATGKRTFAGDQPLYTKTMNGSPESLASYQNEMLAHQLFEDQPWMPPVLARGDRSLSIPLFPEESRLDRLVASLPPSTRAEVARQSMHALFEMFVRGYAHRDFHGKNLFWLDGQLYVIDFEGLAAYPDGRRPPFPLSYDIVGKGLDSPHQTGHMCYCRANTRTALEGLLQVPVARALEALQEDIKQELYEVSLTFQKKSERHVCKAKRIYNSFSLPYLAVHKDEAQRHSARRLENFGITEATIKGKSLLDLGSHVGGMIFETQKLGPIRSFGVEYDADKVAVAKRVAAYNGLNTVQFARADIDELTISDLGGRFDIVYCLAISEHVKKRDRLFRLLHEVTGEALFFEGNSTTDPRDVQRKLVESGFRNVQILGPSDDDSRPENNRRPLLTATR